MFRTEQAVNRFRQLLGITLGVLFVASTPYCYAASGVWTNAGGGTYDSSSNWSGGTVADGAGFTADFSQVNITSDVVLTVPTNVTIGHLIFGDSDLSSGGSWEVSSTSPATQLTLDADSPTVTVNTLTPATFDDVYFVTNLAGTNGFTKKGAGIFTVAGGSVNHTITGGIHIDEGTLRLEGATPGQEIHVADGATLEVFGFVDLDSGHTIIVPSGTTANFKSADGAMSAAIGNVDAGGATINVLVGSGSDFAQNQDWALSGSPAAVNISSPDGTGIYRVRVNAGNTNTAAFEGSQVSLDNVTLYTRTNSFGNVVNFGSLSGTSTAVLSGGGQGGGTAATYEIGSLDLDSEYTGAIDSAAAVDPDGSLNIRKVGTGTLTLSGPLSYQPAIEGRAFNTPEFRGGMTIIQEGTIALTGSTAINGGLNTVLGDLPTTISVEAAGTLDVTGYTAGSYSTAPIQQVVGTGTIRGDYNHDEGNLLPGNSAADLNPVTAPVAGQITFDGDFTLGGGDVTFDISPNPGLDNDHIQVTGTTHLAGSTFRPNFLGDIPQSGTYTLLTSAGGFSGSVNTLTFDYPGRGADPTVQIQGNSLVITAPALGAAADLVWTGANGSAWDVEVTQNWANDGSSDQFFDLDNVTFNDTASTTTVTLDENVQPASVTINNTGAYSITGGGAISGGTGLTKTGGGMLTIQTANQFTGTTSLSGNATIDIGAVSSALGLGPLELGGATIVGIDGADLDNSSVTVLAGTTNGFNVVGGNDTQNISDIPELLGTGVLNLDSDVGTEGVGKYYALNGTSEFAGTLNLIGNPVGGVTGLVIQLAGADSTLPDAVVNADNTTILNRTPGPGNITIAFGELHGNFETVLDAYGGAGAATERPNVTWEIGNLNTDSEFAGTIVDDGTEDTILTKSAITKVGTGTLVLSGLNTYTGDTTVEQGTLSITNAYLADTADVYLSTGVTLNLDFAGTDVIDSLFIDGVGQAVGTWGRTGSGAEHQSGLFSGDGLLMVSTVGVITLDGDFDMDGDVDGADFLVWQQGGSPNPLSSADLSLWQANYGQTNMLSASASPVPEPRGWLLVLTAGLVGAIAYRRLSAAPEFSP